MRIDGKQTNCGLFKTEIAAAKRVNSICKKHGMKLKNPELSDEEEEENFTLPNKNFTISKLLYMQAYMKMKPFIPSPLNNYLDN